MPVAIVTVTSPSALELLEVFTVTVWGTFQLAAVKVKLLGDKLTPEPDVVIGIVTAAVGGEVSTAV